MTATSAVYQWLVANPAKPGTLTAAGTKVAVPTPAFGVEPPSVTEPAPLVKAVVNPPEPERGQIWGPAVWANVYETETDETAELSHLLTEDALVPKAPAQTGLEWVLTDDPYTHSRSRRQVANCSRP